MVEVNFPHRCKEQITDLLEPGSSNLQIREERALQMETLEFEFSVVLLCFLFFLTSAFGSLGSADFMNQECF